MFEKNPNKCRHPGCNCEVQKGTKYCSDYCESMFNQPSFACECGHEECGAGETVSSAPAD